MKKSISVKSKLISYSLFLIIFSTLTMGFITDNYIHTFFHKNAKKQLQEVFFSIAKNLKNIEKNLIRSVYITSKDESIIASLNIIQNYKSDLFDEKKRIVNILLNDSEHSAQDHIAIYDSQYKLLAFVDREKQNNIQGFVSYKDSKAIYHTKKIDSNLPYTSSEAPKHFLKFIKISKRIGPYELQSGGIEFKNINNTLNMGITHPIVHKVSKNTNNIIGYISTENFVHINEINDELGEINVDIQYYFNNNKDFKILTNNYTDSPLLFSKYDVEELTLKTDNETFSSAVRTALHNGHMLITASTSNLDAKTSLDKNRTTLIIFVSIIVIVSILISLLLINSVIIIPLRRLVSGVDIIANGDYSQKIEIKRNDEFGIISNRFNEMADKIAKREKDLDSMVHQDILTKIPNRIMFNERLDDALSRAKRLNKKLAVFFLDLDEFKTINDTLGHDFGDRLLIQVANNLVHVMRKNDLLARIGGDEFNVLIEDLDSVIVAEEIAQKLLKQLSIPIILGDRKVDITASIGISIYPLDAKNTTTLLKNADLAMYDAKAAGKNRYKFFNEELSLTLQNRSVMLNELKSALAKNELELYYQPKFSLKDGSIFGAEALIRWKSKKLGFTSPDNFISLAEESGEIVSIGKWVIEQACKDFSIWQKKGLNIQQVSVNVSNIQFAKDDVVKIVKNALEVNNIDAKHLEVEITESYVNENSKDALTVLNNLRSLGVDLAMDDFGTGYSSMSYLKRLPLTRLKIDKSFIDDIPHDKDDVEITKIIVALAKVMNLSITAEGIETLEQMHFLQELECDEGQGYICSKPLPVEQFISLLENRTNCTAI
ncbi:MAG: GGDEF domain-containing protein [Epsilonproteobacteria bacterium]|nr:MAG: GGDEF domain-containing protein [Campylobacterota bacterium]